MRRFVAFLIILVVLGGAGYYAYSRNWGPATWVTQKLGISGDSKTTANVKSALGLSKRIAPLSITVQTQDSVVTLTGQVPSEAARSLAGQIAQDTAGVREVRNELSVEGAKQPASEGALVEDLEIRAAILEALAHSTELGGKSIEVKVENRKVVLSGSVDTSAQRNGAEQVAGAANGVASVTNEIVVKNPTAATEPPAAPATVSDQNADVAKRVKFELYETGAFDTLPINVKAEDGNVTLSGTVRTRAEQVLATYVAQNTPGVQKVANNLQVSTQPKK